MSLKETKLESWQEWKDKCALVRCQADTQTDIQNWAVPIFFNFLRDNNVTQSLLQEMAGSINGISKAWHAVEAFYHTVSSEHRVTWKDHLVAQVKNSSVGDSRKTFEGITVSRIKQVGTNLYRSDRKWTLDSLDQPVSDDDPHGLTRREITPTENQFSPGDEVAWQELCDIAEHEAELAWNKLSSREAVALGVTFADINASSNREKILPHAGCGWSQFNLAIQTAKAKETQVVVEAAKKHAESDPSDLQLFTRLIQSAFRLCCIEKLPPEISGLDRSFEREN